jgi:hypothetical protein
MLRNCGVFPKNDVSGLCNILLRTIDLLFVLTPRKIPSRCWGVLLQSSIFKRPADIFSIFPFVKLPFRPSFALNVVISSLQRVYFFLVRREICGIRARALQGDIARHQRRQKAWARMACIDYCKMQYYKKLQASAEQNEKVLK